MYIHKIYKLKVNENGSLKLKSRIAPHDNEDRIMSELKSDCDKCSSSGVRFALCFATLEVWRLTKTDVKAAFIQTGQALRDLFVINPCQCTTTDMYWILLTATNGLDNANVKCQSQSDQKCFDLGLEQCRALPQLFFFMENDQLVLLAAKIVHEILFTGVDAAVDKFVDGFISKLEFGSIVHGAGNLGFFGIICCSERRLLMLGK